MNKSKNDKATLDSRAKWRGRLETLLRLNRHVLGITTCFIVIYYLDAWLRG